MRKCKICKDSFRPENEIQPVCMKAECAIPFAQQKKAKEQRKAKSDMNQNDKSHLMRVAQREFNKYIRLRDAKDGCISCGHDGDRQFHAGHLKSVGGNGNLRFNEDNCWKQCSICNNHLSGNVGEYEKNLRAKIGDARVDALDVKVPKSYSVEELKEIIDTYKTKIKAIND